MTLLSGFKALLSRYTQQEDIVIGTAVDRRNAPELETAAGVFREDRTGSLPAQRGNPPFRELLRRVRDVMLATHDLMDVPFRELAEALHTPGGPSRRELLKVMCVMEPGVPVPPSGWECRQVQVQTGTAKFELLYEFEERDGGVLVRAERNSDLYEATTVDRLSNHLVHLLQSAVTDPEQPIGQIPLLSNDACRALLLTSAGIPRPYARDATVHGMFAHQVARRGGAVAVIDGKTTLSYNELNSRAKPFCPLPAAAWHCAREHGGALHGPLVGIHRRRSGGVEGGRHLCPHPVWVTRTSSGIPAH